MNNYAERSKTEMDQNHVNQFVRDIFDVTGLLEALPIV